MEPSVGAWVALVVVVVIMLVIDLAFFGRRSADKTISARTALIWSVIWTAIGFAFTLHVWWLDGSIAAQEYLAGFMIEKMLSLDNLFVFAVIFMYFKVPPYLQRRAIFWGIVGAIVLRAIFIFAGAALLDAAHWMIYVFGAFLIYTAVRMLKEDEEHIDPEHTLIMRLFHKVIPTSNTFHGERYFVRLNGVLHATPMLAVLVMIAAFDALFALDSIPAIFAITRDTYVVASANAMSLLGLTALYFLLVDAMRRFEHLNIGLAIVLAFVGVKMLLADVYHIPVWISLVVICLVLGATIGYSLHATSENGKKTPAPDEGTPVPPAGS